MIKVKINEREYRLEKKDNDYQLNQQKIGLDLSQLSKDEFHVISHDLSITTKVLSFSPEQKELTISIKGKTFTLKIMEENDEILEKMNFAVSNSLTHQKIISPMPGLVQKIMVKENDDVSTGETVLILNAMKMENVLKSPVTGKVNHILVKEGEQVEKGKVLIQF